MPRQTLKQRADGRYVCKYHGQSFYGYTQKEALEAREAFKRVIENGMRAEALGITVKAYSAKWVSTYKAHLTNGPYNTHVRLLDRFCEHNDIGSRPIRSIDTSDIQSFYNTAQGKSHSYICDMRDTIKGLFKYALADRVIQYDPTLKAKPPKGNKGTHRAIMQWERDIIHQTAHRIRPAVMTMLYAGLRRGEALAINVDRDVDFKQKTITVREAVRFYNQQTPILVDPKTEAGVRTIPLLDVLADELRGMHGLLLSRDDGSLYTEKAWHRAWESYIVTLETKKNGIHKRWYGRTKEQLALKEAGKLQPWVDVTIRPHDLRHSYCTMLYDANVDLKTAQKWMGHADQEMTMRIYTHLTEEKEKTASEALEKAAKKLASSQNGSQSQETQAEQVDL